MIKRTIEPHLLRLAKQYPVITMTGPRQLGKTTLCQTAFPHKRYISLENLDTRRMAASMTNTALFSAFRTIMRMV